MKRRDTLVILEAMKMQTAVPAEASGTLKRLICRQDHVVDTGDLLPELELEGKAN